MAERKLPEDYDGTPICPRCGDGWPVCAQGISHEESCAKYVFRDDLCDTCLILMDWAPADSTLPAPVYTAEDFELLTDEELDSFDIPADAILAVLAAFPGDAGEAARQAVRALWVQAAKHRRAVAADLPPRM
ncbi:hypothetical protein [Agromyces humi]|uniref:hypothetical protein n=1 Tax=Agromyces humi TaxID=1766800 RepID=UPI001358112C|nr:hypothetical protein [Agromyces humi]